MHDCARGHAELVPTGEAVGLRPGSQSGNAVASALGASKPAVLVVKALLAVVIGMLVGGGLNALLGEQGADTPALVLLGGGLALGTVLVARVRGRRRKAQDD